MNLDEVLAELERHASPERKQRVARLGIPEEQHRGRCARYSPHRKTCGAILVAGK